MDVTRLFKPFNKNERAIYIFGKEHADKIYERGEDYLCSVLGLPEEGGIVYYKNVGPAWLNLYKIYHL